MAAELHPHTCPSHTLHAACREPTELTPEEAKKKAQQEALSKSEYSLKVNFTREDGSVAEDHLPNLTNKEIEMYYADKLEAKAVQYADAATAAEAQSWKYNLNADNVREAGRFPATSTPPPQRPR